MLSNLHIVGGPLDLAETLLNSTRVANSLNGSMAYQHHAYGRIQDALIETLACAVADAHIVHFDEARRIARRLVDEAVDNGESIAYQIDLWNDGVIGNDGHMR